MSSNTNIITVYFHGKHQTCSKTQYQYHHGQILYFADLDLPDAFEVHFSNTPRGKSKTQVGTNNQVDIPDEYFWNGATEIYAWIYLHAGLSDGETEYEVKIPLKKRSEPSDEEPSDVQQSAIDQAIAALATAVEKTSDDVEEVKGIKTDVQGLAHQVELDKESADLSATTASAQAQEAIRNNQQAQEYASNAEASATDASNNCEQARRYAVQAEEYKDIATQKSEIATNASETALEYKNETGEIRDEVLQIKNDTKDYSINAKQNLDETVVIKNEVTELKNQVTQSAEAVEDNKSEVERLATTVTEKANQATSSANLAYQSATVASNSATTANTKAQEASASAEQAGQSASSANESAQDASEYSQSANEYAQSAQQAKEDAEIARDEAEANVRRLPYVGSDGYWYEWNTDIGAFVNTGTKAEGIDNVSFWISPTAHFVPCNSEGIVKEPYVSIVAFGAYKGTEPIECIVKSITGNSDVIDNFVIRRSATSQLYGIIDVSFVANEVISNQTTKNYEIKIILEANGIQQVVRCEVVSVLDGVQGIQGIQGKTGDTGNGISSTVLNNDYTLTINYTNGTDYTTDSIRGEKGDKGDTGESGIYVGTDEPINENVNVWIDTDGDTSDGTVEGINQKLEYLINNIPTDTATGAVVSFADGGNNIPLKSLTVGIEPVQDLNGQDAPYPAGGGVNLLPPVSGTKNGITFTPNSDGTVHVEGEYDSNTWTYITTNFVLSEIGLSVGDTITLITDVYIGITFLNENSGRISSKVTSSTITVAIPDGTVRIQVYCYSIGTYEGISGTTENRDIKYLLAKGSVSEWTPYSNVCPITGWTGMSGARTGANIFGGKPMMDSIYAVGGNPSKDETNNTVTFTAQSGVHTVWTYPFEENTQYTFVFTIQQSQSGHTGTNIAIYYTNGTRSYVDKAKNTDKQTIVLVSTSSKTVARIALINSGGTTTVYCNESGVFKGVLTADDFEAYTGQDISIQFGQTVYGGNINITTGVLTVDRAIKTVSSVDAVTASYVKSDATDGYVFENDIYPRVAPTVQPDDLCSDCLDFRKAMIWALTGYPNTFCVNQNQIHVNIANELIGVVYGTDTNVTAKEKLNAYLAEHPVTVTIPITPSQVQLTAQEVLSLLGSNNIFADCGNTTVEYRADTNLYITKKINEAISKLS